MQAPPGLVAGRNLSQKPKPTQEPLCTKLELSLLLASTAHNTHPPSPPIPQDLGYLKKQQVFQKA